ncbi:MAG: manganese efflux pump [Clostridia bacterium]|nr:manganese efflux pump [Clostridia bacterium]
MNLGFSFFLNSILFGFGLAMDAFSVSLATGMNEPHLSRGRKAAIPGTFALFQTAMPLIGWVCVHTIASVFTSFHKFIPWIALILLLYIGGKMLYEGISKKSEEEQPPMNLRTLFVMGIATSIDALSVGFTIADCTLPEALIESVLIGAVTFAVCFAGVELGRKIGVKLADRASILGGLILIFIGLEIFLSGAVFGR